jgi:hypothetical protein
MNKGGALPEKTKAQRGRTRLRYPLCITRLPPFRKGLTCPVFREKRISFPKIGQAGQFRPSRKGAAFFLAAMAVQCHYAAFARSVCPTALGLLSLKNLYGYTALSLRNEAKPRPRDAGGLGAPLNDNLKAKIL